MLLCMRTKSKLTLTPVKSSNGVVKRAFTQMFYPCFFCKLLNTFFLTGYRAVDTKGKRPITDSRLILFICKFNFINEQHKVLPTYIKEIPPASNCFNGKSV